MLNRLSTPSNLADLVNSIAIQVEGSSQFKRFQRLYRNDRVAFAHDILGKLGKNLTYYQEEILGLFDDGYTRVAVRGPHGLGKTFMASILTHHSILTAEYDAKTITTASAWRQLEKYLWPEIRKISQSLEWSLVGREPYDPNKEFLGLSIRLLSRTVEAFAVASDDFNTIEGAHARQLVYIFDEAKAIPRQTWNAAEGAFSNAKNMKMKPDELDNIQDIRKSLGYTGRLIISGEQGEVENNREQSDPDMIKVQGEINGSDWRALLDGDMAVDNGRSTESNSGLDLVVDQKSSIPMSTGGFSSPNSAFDQAVPHAHTPSSDAGPSAAMPDTQSHGALDDAILRKVALRKTSTLYTTESDGSTDRAFAFAISTPGDPSGQFYDIHTHRAGYEDWVTKHVTIDDAIRAGRVSHEWVEQRKRQWGADSSIFQNRVLGEFADASEDGVIPLSWVRAAVSRWHTWHNDGAKEASDAKHVLGVDVARSGFDKTVMARRIALVIADIYHMSKLSTTAVARYIHAIAKGATINIEMDGGLGAAVYDILRDPPYLQPNLRPITVGAATIWHDRSKELAFANVRAAMWWNMRELLNPEYHSEVCLPPIEELITDLSTPHWEPRPNGVIVLESKESIYSRIGRSTDYGDAVCLSFWNAHSGGGVVF